MLAEAWFLLIVYINGHIENKPYKHKEECFTVLKEKIFKEYKEINRQIQRIDCYKTNIDE